jgi:DNA-directed RNA polymerase I, II, and III subunit RPABC2
MLEDDDEQPGGGEDPDNLEDNVVVSGDASAAAQAKESSKNTVHTEKSLRVENKDRTTTPYMTKYEKARVLGTRALQIRWVTARHQQAPWD